MAEDAAYLAQYNGGALVGTAVSFLALTYLSVGLRTYVRAFLTKCFLADDWLMLAAQVRTSQPWGDDSRGRNVLVLTTAAGRLHGLLYLYITRH